MKGYIEFQQEQVEAIEFKRGPDKKKRKERSKLGMAVKGVGAVAGLGAAGLAARRYGGTAVGSFKNMRNSGASIIGAARGGATKAGRLAVMDAKAAPGAALNRTRAVGSKIRREVDIRRQERNLRRG